MSEFLLPFDSESLEQLKKLVRDAGDAILNIYHSDDFNIELKGDQSPVTKADLAAHHILVKGLAHITPEIPIVSEEDSNSLEVPKTNSLYWLIDPLDGTKEFINKRDEFTVNLALIENHQSVFGFVGVPALNTLYWGGKDYKAYKATEPSQAEQINTRKPSNILKVFASKSHLNADTEAFIQNLPSETELVQAGSSLKFLRIAEGEADIYPRLAPTCEWDTAAAHAVLEGAGGSVHQVDNEPVIYGKSDILNPYFIAKGY